MDIFQDYMMHPRKPWRLVNPTLTREENNPLCDDALILDLCIEEWVVTDFAFSWNISLTAVASLSFLYDTVCGMTVDEICLLDYSFFADHGIVVTMRRQKTLALPLVALINACKQRRGDPDRLDSESFVTFG